MNSFIEIANRLAKHFVSSEDKFASADYIISQINMLIYSETKKPLDIDDKRLLVKYIGEFISQERPLQYREGGLILIVEAKDNTDYLDMIDYILNQLNN